MFSKCYAGHSVANLPANHQIANVIQSLGDVNFTYSLLNKDKPRELHITSSMPEWYDNYKKNEMQLTDPVVMRALTGEGDFYWDQSAMKASWGNHDIFRAARDFNVASGHIFVIHDQLNNIVMLNLIHKSGTRSSFRRHINKNRELIMSLLRRLHVANQGLQDTLDVDKQQYKLPDNGYAVIRCQNREVVMTFDKFPLDNKKSFPIITEGFLLTHFRSEGPVSGFWLRSDEFVTSLKALDAEREKAGLAATDYSRNAL